MLPEAAQSIASVFFRFFENNAAVLLFIVGFTVLACLFGLRQRVLSRAAITNTLTTLAVVFGNVALAPFVSWMTGKMQGFYEVAGIPAVDPQIWLGLPWVFVALLTLISKDFCDYWSHRALHTPLGWPIHAVHHSDSHVNGFTTFRVHALEIVVMRGFEITLLSWAGFPPDTVALIYLIALLHNAYVHFEVDIDHGPFNWLLASPRFHRWHHADQPEAYGKNLANMIPAWDMLFGTYLKAGTCHEKMGLERDGISATDPVKLILLPFTLWAKQLRTALSGLFSRARRV